MRKSCNNIQKTKVKGDSTMFRSADRCFIKIITILILISPFFLYSGCSRGGDDSSVVKITGIVTETSGGPIVAGSTVTVSGSGKTTQTDSEGRYYLELEKGNYDFTFEKPGFAQINILDLDVQSENIEGMNVRQPRIFCTDWAAQAPVITVSGVTAGQKVSGSVGIEIKAEGSSPISAIRLRVGNELQGTLATGLNSDKLAFDWDTTALPDGSTYLFITVSDINYNLSCMKIPVTLNNNMADTAVPPVVEDIDPGCYTMAAYYDHDMSREEAVSGRARATRAPANTLVYAALSWKEVKEARGYRVYRGESLSETPLLIGETLGSENFRYYDYDPELVMGKTYYYYISSFNNAGESEKTVGPPITILERFTVRLKSPVDNATGVSVNNTKFEWEISKPVGDVQVYRLIILGFTDGKDNFTLDKQLQNTTSYTLDGKLYPAKEYQWDILNAFAGKDYVSENKYRSLSVPGTLKIDPYVGFPGFVSSSENGAFYFTTEGSGTGTQDDSAYNTGKITVRLKKGITAEELSTSHNLTFIRKFSIGEMNYGIYMSKDGRKQKDVIRELNRDKGVSYAEPHYNFKFDMIPNDPDYIPYQYCHIKMKSGEAWNITTGSENIIMAILDTGIDGTHPEFQDRCVTGHNFSTGEDVPPGTHFDSYGHGTHVAGIAGATGNNNIGIAGVNWKSGIMPLKVNDEGDEVAEYVIEAISWAADHNANVMNMSLGSPGYSQALQDAITYACKKNSVIVVSMGNSGTAVGQFPAGCRGVIPVGSTNGRDELSDFSTWGNYISVCAPGENIYSTSKKDHGYVSQSGTSMSTPQVVGAVALLQSIHPDWTPEEIRSQLESTCDDIGDTGFDRKTGWGRINLYRLLSSAKVINKYGRIRIFVKDASGAGLDGADVLLKNAKGETTATLRTDSDGYAYFFYIPTGTGYSTVARYGDRLGASIESFEVKVNDESGEQAVTIDN